MTKNWFMTKEHEIIDLNSFERFWVSKGHHVFGWREQESFEFAKFESEKEAIDYLQMIFNLLAGKKDEPIKEEKPHELGINCTIHNRAPMRSESSKYLYWLHADGDDWTVYINRGNGTWEKKRK